MLGGNMAQFFMEFLRGAVTMEGADTYGSNELKTPVGRANKLAMAIHQIEFEHEKLDTVATEDDVDLQLTMNEKTEIVPISNSDYIDGFSKGFSLVTSGAVVHERKKKNKFYPPLLYAKSSMYLGMDTTGQGAAKSGYVRLGYTLRYVSATRMVQALVD